MNVPFAFTYYLLPLSVCLCRPASSVLVCFCGVCFSVTRVFYHVPKCLLVFCLPRSLRTNDHSSWLLMTPCILCDFLAYCGPLPPWHWNLDLTLLLYFPKSDYEDTTSANIRIFTIQISLLLKILLWHQSSFVFNFMPLTDLFLTCILPNSITPWS